MTPTRRLAGPSLACSLLAAALGGCGSSSADPKSPVLDALTMDSTAVASADGSPGDYDVSGKISYHDPDGVIAKIRIYAANAKQDLQLASVAGSASEAPLKLRFNSVKPGTTFDYEVAVVDNDELESNHSKQTVHVP